MEPLSLSNLGRSRYTPSSDCSSSASAWWRVKVGWNHLGGGIREREREKSNQQSKNEEVFLLSNLRLGGKIH